jgi:hypothetical protein
MVEGLEVKFLLVKKFSQIVCVTLLFQAVLVAPAEAVDQRPIDVVELTWSGSAPLTTSQSEIVSKVNGEVRSRWESLTSFSGGNLEQRIQFFSDRVLPDPIKLVSPLACNRPDFSSFMNSIRNEAYKRLSIDSFSDRYLIILMPDSNCIWEGRSLIGTTNSKSGTIILQDTSDAFVIAHELGHSLGLGHSNFMRCDLSQKDSAWNNCKAVEYGGTVDLMGNVPTSAPLSTYHQWRMGLLKDSQVKEIWQTQTISLSAVDMLAGVKSIFVRDGKSTYWIEFRRERLESGYKSGLVIYRTDPPPMSSIVSPNSENLYGDGFNLSVTSDMWLINLDNFSYENSRSSGSMTLNLNKSFTAYSGNFSLEITEIAPNQDSATISIKRALDLIAPPQPRISISGELRNSQDLVLQKGFEDLESYVDSFEIKKNEELIPIVGRKDPAWKQTYLQPFNTSKVLTISDLPEGKYSLSVRTIDIAGNKSQWSAPQYVNIDRGAPMISNRINIESMSKGMARIKFVDVIDEGSQLCGTSLYNYYDFVLQYSESKISPIFEFEVDKDFESRMQVTDCLGNIQDAKVKVGARFFDGSAGSKTGNWKVSQDLNSIAQAKCLRKCTVSIATLGHVAFSIASSQLEILVSGKKISIPKNLMSTELINIDLGAKKKIVRISGRDLVFRGYIQASTIISDEKSFDATVQGVDPSLNLQSQSKLISLGFRSMDFVNGWRVLPMAGGTETSDPTLDLCGNSYKSEKARVNRRQLVVSRANTPYAFLSSESVEYIDSAAAKLGLTELKENYAACKEAGGWSDNLGLFSKYRFLDVSTQESLLNVQDAVVVHATLGEGQNARTLFAIYQFVGNFFTGIYVVKNGDRAFDENELRQWTSVAKKFSTRLNKK